MRSFRAQLLGSASAVAVAITFGGALFIAKAQAETVNVSGGATPPLNNGILNPANTYLSVNAVAYNPGDSANIVTLDGLVTANGAYPHLGAFGVFVDGGAGSFGAYDNPGSGNNALATNQVTGTGYVSGPGVSSYGTTVAGLGYFATWYSPLLILGPNTAGIEAQAAQSQASDSAGSDITLYRASAAANSVDLTGTVGGGSSISGGIMVTGIVDSAFAESYLDVNFNGYKGVAVGVSDATNYVSLTGTVGGSGNSDGSTGIGIGYANSSIANSPNGSALAYGTYAEGGMFNLGNGSNAQLQVNSANALLIEGDVIGSGGVGASGVSIANFAEASYAEGYGIITGYDNSTIVGIVSATNTVDIAGRNLSSGVGLDNSTGVTIGNYVQSSWAEAYSWASMNDTTVGSFSPFVNAQASAINSVDINGTVGNSVSGTDVSGVHIGGYVESRGAFAEAGATLTTSIANMASATIQADSLALNVVSVTGTAGLNSSTGVWIGSDVYASFAEAGAYAIGGPGSTLSSAGNTITGIANATASNAVAIDGYVGTPGTEGSTGVAIGLYQGAWTTYGVSAEWAEAGSTVSVSVNSGSGIAKADGESNVFAGNIVSITGSVGPSVTNSTGVAIAGGVFAEQAWSYNSNNTSAYSSGQATLAGAGATATASSFGLALNGVTIDGTVGNNSNGSTGVDPLNVYAEGALAYDNTTASAGSTFGGSALGTADDLIIAANLVGVSGAVGDTVANGVGVAIAGQVYAYDANAYGGASVYATVNNLGSTIGGGTATADASLVGIAGNAVGIVGSVGTQDTSSVGVTVGGDGWGVGADDAYVSMGVNAYANSYDAGLAKATADGLFVAGNILLIDGTVGDPMVHDTVATSGNIGVAINGEGSAGWSRVYGGAYASAYSTLSSSYGTGGVDAIADSLSFAVNGVSISGYAAAEGVSNTGVTLSGNAYGSGVGTYDAYAYDSSSAYGSAYNGLGATSSAGAMGAGLNLVGIEGSVGNYNTYSYGVAITGDVYAENASGEGSAYSSAYSSNTVGPASSGGATATASATGIGLNYIGISGAVGTDGYYGNTIDNNPNDSYDVGVLVNGDVYAEYATAEGSASAYSNAYNGSSLGTPSKAVAQITSEGGNIVDITGTVGPWSDNNAGVVINGGVYAEYSTAEGNAYASAYSTLTGSTIPVGGATALATGFVQSGNMISINGGVGDFSEGSTGVDPYMVEAYDTNAYGQSSAYATAYNGGAAIASAEGIVQATNTIAVSGFVGANNYESTGVEGGTGIYADTAEGYGTVNANAYGAWEGGPYPWSGQGVTATANGMVLAANEVALTGTIATSDSTFGLGYYNTGVVVFGDVYAEGAYATGGAEATATSFDYGTAVAMAYGGVQALNSVAINGVVGDSNDYSSGVAVLGNVYAEGAAATGNTSAYASVTNGGGTLDVGGDATAVAVGSVTASNGVMVSGSVGYNSWHSTGVDPNSVYAEGALASSYSQATATIYGPNGTASASATDSAGAYNYVGITGSVGNYAEGSTGVYINSDVYAYDASAQDTVLALASGSQYENYATASASAVASNIVSIMGSVGNMSEGSYGVDPAYVYASNAYASSSASVTVQGEGSAVATATANAGNTVSAVGLVGDQSNNAAGVYIDYDVTASGATASAYAGASGSNYAPANATATAIAINEVDLFGGVGSTSSNAYGVYVGGNVYIQDLGVTVSVSQSASAGGVAAVNATLENIANLTGTVANYSTASNGVYIGGDVYMGGTVSATGSANAYGGTYQITSNAENLATIAGSVGTNSDSSHGVYIGGNFTAENMVSEVTIAGTDLTDKAGSRGVWIGGNVTTGDALHSDVFNSSGLDGDRLTMMGSVYVGGSVSTGDGNDQVLVKDTFWQMTVVGGFDGGANPTITGQDTLTFDNASMFVTNIDNFELMNVTNNSWVVLQNNAPYEYSVRDQTNVYDNSVLSLGSSMYDKTDIGYSGNPGAETGVFNTAILSIGGDPLNNFTVKNPTADDSVLQAEFDGSGSYVVNGDVYNFGTITMSQILSQLRGGPASGPFDSEGAQEYWALHSWNMDPSSNPGDVLTINGNYTAGSDLILDAFVKKNIPVADQLIINGGDVSGVTTIWVNNTNTGSGANTGHGPTDGVELVIVNNDQTPADLEGKFVLGNRSGWNFFDPIKFPDPELQVGAYVYKLVQAGPTGQDFYLQSDLLDQVPAYTVMSSAIQNAWYAELGTLYQRLGEVRHGESSAAPVAGQKGFEVWLKGYGTGVTTDPNKGFKFDQDTKGFLVGADYTWKNGLNAHSRIMTGVFAGYGWTDINNIKQPVGHSDADTKGYTVGGYATYYDTAIKGQGLYADAVVKANFLDSSYHSSTRNSHASSSDTALGASLEVGYGIGLGSNFIIQPQGQLSYVNVFSDSFTDHSPGMPLHVKRDSADSLRGRAGLQLQGNFESGETQISPYVIGNVLHEFLGDNKTTVAGSKFTNDMSGTWYNVGAGLSVDIRNVGFYGELGYSFGQIEGINGSAGVKVRF